MNTLKTARTEIDIMQLLKNRWSPRAYKDKPIDREKLIRMFEAARWSASCFNEQPWRFIIGERGKDDSFEKLFSTLKEGNKVWCKNVPLLFLIAGKKTFTHNDKHNAHAIYDCGQAAAYITIQALEDNIYVHQMAGFEAEEAIDLFSIPDDFTPITVCAAGYLGDADTLPENLEKNEKAPRSRLGLSHLFFGSKWDQLTGIF